MCNSKLGISFTMSIKVIIQQPHSIYTGINVVILNLI